LVPKIGLNAGMREISSLHHDGAGDGRQGRGAGNGGTDGVFEGKGVEPIIFNSQIKIISKTIMIWFLI
jgi:hypothetical protein